MNVDFTIKKLHKDSSEGEEGYEAIAVSDTGIAIGAIGKDAGKAMKELHKKLKEWRRFIFVAMPILEFKQKFHSYTFKITSKE